MKKFFLFFFMLTNIFVLTNINSGFGQSTQNIDSLKKIIYSDAPAVSRDSAMFWASWYYLNIDLDSSLYYAQKAYDYSKKIPCKPIEGFSLQIIGNVYAYRGNNAKALELLYKGLDIFESLKDSLGRASINYDLGNIFFSENDTTKAFNYWRSALQFAPATPLGNTVKSWTLTNLGWAYSYNKQYDKALNYAMQAHNFIIKGSENKYLGGIYDLMGVVQYHSGNPIDALEYNRAAAAEHIKNHNPNNESDSYLRMAQAFEALKPNDSVFYYARKSIALSQQLKVTAGLVAPAKILVDLFRKENRYDSAFKYQQLINDAKDSLFSQEKIRQVQNIIFNEQMRQQEKALEKQQYRNNLKMFALAAGLVAVLLIAGILYRSNRQKHKANTLLQIQKAKTEIAMEDLKATQAQLIQSEKMASLGGLTAGIAHEIRNPLNFVNNFSEVSVELIDEWKEELAKDNKQKAISISDNVKQNLEKIIHHGQRADAIVKGMLEHSRSSTGQKEPTDINALADEYLRLSYHGLRAKDKSFKAIIKTDFDKNIEKINAIPQDIGRVLLNLFNNAFYAVTEKKKAPLPPKGGNENPQTEYEPTVTVSTKALRPPSGVGGLEIRVKDNGVGIPQKVLDKIFQPFFTTKPTGQGTGLGLSLSYDIIKAHGGEIKVETKEGEGAEFIIKLPVK